MKATCIEHRACVCVYLFRQLCFLQHKFLLFRFLLVARSHRSTIEWLFYSLSIVCVCECVCCGVPCTASFSFSLCGVPFTILPVTMCFTLLEVNLTAFGCFGTTIASRAQFKIRMLTNIDDSHLHLQYFHFLGRESGARPRLCSVVCLYVYVLSLIRLPVIVDGMAKERQLISILSNVCSFTYKLLALVLLLPAAWLPSLPPSYVTLSKLI